MKQVEAVRRRLAPWLFYERDLRRAHRRDMVAELMFFPVLGLAFGAAVTVVGLLCQSVQYALLGYVPGGWGWWS